MTRRAQLNTALFPDYPRETPVINQSMNFTDIWHVQLSILFQTLQKTFTNEGFKNPSLQPSEIASFEESFKKYIGAPLPIGVEDVSGYQIYDPANRELKVFVIRYQDERPSANVVSAEWKSIPLP